MGTFEMPIAVGHPNGGDLVPVTALVDTGASHTMLPASMLEALGLQPRDQEQFSLADGTEVDFGYGTARIAIDGMDWPCPVIFGPEDQYLLGATTLEIFRLGVDPLGGRLVPRRYFVRAI